MERPVQMRLATVPAPFCHIDPASQRHRFHGALPALVERDHAGRRQVFFAPFDGHSVSARWQILCNKRCRRDTGVVLIGPDVRPILLLINDAILLAMSPDKVAAACGRILHIHASRHWLLRGRISHGEDELRSRGRHGAPEEDEKEVRVQHLSDLECGWVSWMSV